MMGFELRIMGIIVHNGVILDSYVLFVFSPTDYCHAYVRRLLYHSSVVAATCISHLQFY